jgi:hypothetical protein
MAISAVRGNWAPGAASGLGQSGPILHQHQPGHGPQVQQAFVIKINQQ